MLPQCGQRVGGVVVCGSGGIVGGIPFGRGPLAHILRNRFYIGQVAFKGEVMAGASSPLSSTGPCSMKSRPS